MSYWLPAPLRARLRALQRAYLAAERGHQPDLHALDAAALATIATRVAQADEAVRQVLAVVAPLAPPAEASQ